MFGDAASIVGHELRKLCDREEWVLALQLIARVRKAGTPGFAADVYELVRREKATADLTTALAEPPMRENGTVDIDAMETVRIEEALRVADDVLSGSAADEAFEARVDRARVVLKLRQLLREDAWDDAVAVVTREFEQEEMGSGRPGSEEERSNFFSQINCAEWTARVCKVEGAVTAAIADSSGDLLEDAMREAMELIESADEESEFHEPFVRDALEWIEFLQQREARIEGVRDQIEHAMANVDRATLTAALVSAYDAGIESSATESAVAKLLEVRAAEPLVDSALELDVFGDAALHAANAACEEAGLASPKAKRVRALLELPKAERLQAQLRAAFQSGNLALAARCAHAMKSSFFAPEHGRLAEFTLARCSLLRSREELAAVAGWLTPAGGEPVGEGTIATSLTVALRAPQEVILAREAFWLIRQLFSGETLTSKTIAPQCMRRLVEIALSAPAMCDEVLCQVMTQLERAPRSAAEERRRGWALLHACMLCFAPSPPLENFVEAFIRREGEDHARLAMQLHVAIIHSVAGAGADMAIAGLDRAIALVSPPSYDQVRYRHFLL